MTATQLRAIRERLGLTQHRAASLCGVEIRTWRRWETGERNTPDPIQRLLWLLETLPGVERALERLDAGRRN